MAAQRLSQLQRAILRGLINVQDDWRPCVYRTLFDYLTATGHRWVSQSLRRSLLNLTKKGLIETIPTPDDRSGVHTVYRLSPAGQAVCTAQKIVLHEEAGLWRYYPRG